jgi:type IV pilus assembly protein PilA
MHKGFSLIELMVVVAVIGILATVALPSYRDYTIRSQISEAVGIANYLKTAVEENFQIKGTLPDSFPASVSVNNPIVKNYNLYKVSASEIRIEIELQNILPSGQSTRPIFQLFGNVSGENLVWKCGSNTSELHGIPRKYLPSSCQEIRG